LKFVSTRDNLLRALQAVGRVISTKNPVPVLASIKMEAAADRLVVAATDLEIGLFCTVAAGVLEEGKAVIPARYLVDVIRHLPDTEVEIASLPDGSGISLRYGQNRTSLFGFPEEEFPYLSIPEGDFSFELESGLCREILQKTLYAVSTEESRAIFTGALFEIDEAALTVVATDIHRLALKKVPLPNVSGGAEGTARRTIIPGKALNELARLLSGPGDKVTCTLLSHQAAFTYQNFHLFCRLIQGEYPSYRRMIPEQERSGRIRFRAQELLAAVERAAALADKSGAPVVSLSVEGGLLQVMAETVAGNLRENLPAEVEGEDVEIHFNTRFVSDALKVMEGEELTMELYGPFSPCILRPSGEKDYLAMLLPVRLG